jgi:hypothetical protein
VHLRPERLAPALLCAILCLAASRSDKVLWNDENRVRGAIPLSILARGDVAGAFENAFYLTSGRPGLVFAFLPSSLASLAIGGVRPVGDPSAAVEIDELDRRCAHVVAALWAAAGVLGVGALGERLRGRGAGAVASALLGLSVVQLVQGSTLLPSVPALALGTLFLDRHLRAIAAGDDVARARREGGKAGLALAALFSVYPGAYALGATLAADVLLHRRAARERTTAIAGAFLGALVAFEAVYRLACGGSYFADLLKLSGTILVGDPREGWSFPFEYLWRCDGLLGAGAFLLGLASVAWARGEARFLALSLALLYAAEGLLVSTILGKHVLYGRIVTPWLALAVPVAAAALPLEGRRAPIAVLAIALHQGPGLAHAVAIDPQRHPAALYENCGPAQRRQAIAALSSGS